MASVISSELRVSASRLERRDVGREVEDRRYAVSLMRASANHIERQLKTLKKYRLERKQSGAN